jgi:signal transduction histidine kinase
VLITAAATALGYLINVGLATPATFLTFFPTLFACTWVAGRTGGLWSLVLCAPGILYLLPPVGFAMHHTPGAWTSVAIFVATGFIIIWTTSQLQKAIAWRETLLSMVSHDLKTPLSTIMLKADILRRAAETGSPAPDKIAIQADGITRQVSRLLLMINNLLDMSRVRAERLDLVPSEVDLAEVVKEVIERFRAEFDHGQGTVKLIGAEQPVRGLWDRMGVEQITANLVANAIKYGDKKPIEITVRCDDQAAWLVVSDQGRGMSREEQRHIFEAFGRGSGAKKTAGHGLGLWIVSTYVKAHKGRVEVESEIGVGSTFRVALPLRRSA